MTRLQRIFSIVVLIFAGESIYMLPYLRRTFQTSMESLFDVTSTELGFLNAMFGLLAMLCYFPGGWVADQVSSRKLMTFSLISTGLLGLYMTTFPGYVELLILHGLWGITTILTFWAALVKATRNWGNPDNQGTTFGLLDGGRGLTAALLASIAVWLFENQGAGDSPAGLRTVMYFYAASSLAAGVAAWFILPKADLAESPADVPAMAEGDLDDSWGRVKAVLSLPQVWLMATIVLSAYWLYVTSFDFPAFAEKTYDQTKVFGAKLGTFRDWLRPVAALGAGLIADRLRVTRVIAGCFVILAVAYAALAFGPTDPSAIWMLWIEVTAVAICVFALRGVYYALLEESNIPMLLTGTTVGVMSVLGYLPEIYSYPLIGWFVDYYQPDPGYHYYFGLMVIVAVFGLTATLLMRRVVRQQGESTTKAAPA
jgi:sugar phosphate permease